jgi:hypothetical protein
VPWELPPSREVKTPVLQGFDPAVEAVAGDGEFWEGLFALLGVPFGEW